jgi:hypothetical protein
VNRSIVILLAMSFAAMAILFVVLEMWKLTPKRGGDGALGGSSAPAGAGDARSSARGAGRGGASGGAASDGLGGAAREGAGERNAQFKVRVIDLQGAAAPNATLLAQGTQTTIEQTGDEFDVKGTIPLVLVAQAAGFAGPVVKTVDAPPKGTLFIHVFHEVKIAVELSQNANDTIPKDHGYLAIIGGATMRHALSIDGALTRSEVTAPEGECQFCFVGERLASAPVNAIVQAGAQVPLALAKRPAGTVRVRIDGKGFAAPKLTFPLAPADVAATDPLVPVAVRDPATSDGDLFVFEGIPAGPVTATCDDAAHERTIRASGTLDAGGTLELVLR